MVVSVLLILSLLSSSSSYAMAQDFCAADMSAEGPEGFKCKKPSAVTAKDFVFSGLTHPANISKNPFKQSLLLPTVAQFPGLNGMGVVVARLDLDVGGVSPLHSHPRAAEIAVVTSGSAYGGFIAGDNTVYSTNLKAGDAFLIPKGLFHFFVNSGDSPFAGYAAYSNTNPGIQSVAFALFGNGLPTDLLEKTTLLDADQIKKLKAHFGGSN